MAKKSKFLLEKEYYELLIVKKQYDQMTKPWYKKTEIWKVIVTSSLTLLTIIILYKNGLFDFRSKELQIMNTALEVKKENLEYDIKKFSGAKDSMHSIRDRLESENRILALKNMQIDIANKRAYSSLDQREKYFVKVQQRNVDLERQNQSLADAGKRGNIFLSNYIPNESPRSIGSLIVDQKMNIGDWKVDNNILETINLSKYPLTNINSDNIYQIGINTSNSISTNTLNTSKYIGLGSISNDNSLIFSNYSLPIGVQKVESNYTWPVSFNGNNTYLSTTNNSLYDLLKNGKK